MDTEILELLKLMQSDINGMKNDIKTINSKIEVMDSKIDKNTLMLENLTKKVEVVAEVQKSHMEQNEKLHKETNKLLSDKIDIIELAVKDTSKDVKEIKDINQKVNNLEKVVIQNTYDIACLKAR